MKLTSEQTAWLSELYLNHFSSLFYYAYTELHDAQLAEEAVHEVYVIACRKYEDMISGPNPERWLRKTLKYVLKNAIRSAIRTRNIMTQESVETIPATEDTESATAFDLDMRALLTPEEYRLYRLVYLEGQVLDDAAKALGISGAACRKRVQRLKEKVKKNYFKDLSHF